MQLTVSNHADTRQQLLCRAILPVCLQKEGWGEVAVGDTGGEGSRPLWAELHRPRGLRRRRLQGPSLRAESEPPIPE